jgi:hypothetical protein
MGEKNRPTHEIKLGRIRAAIWSNQNEDRDVWFNVKVSRLYRDKDQWRDTDSFRRDDLLVVAKVVDMAYDWICERQLAQRKQDIEA